MAVNAAFHQDKQGGLRESAALAVRRFGAWWEGYAFNAEAERVAIREGRANANGSTPLQQPEFLLANGIWGGGRFDPGSPAWTMRHGRTLGVALSARVVVLGAGAGGPIQDLRAGGKWKISGFSHFKGAPLVKLRNASLTSYDNAFARLNKGAADGGLCFFELHRDKDPATFLLFASELVKQNASFSFVDFSVVRRDARLRSAFTSPWPGAPKMTNDYAAMLENAGFRIIDTMDETRAFMPLVTQGWANWKTTYDQVKSMPEGRLRADYMRLLAKYAHIWAERFDALKAGQLQVTRIQTRKI